jgi:putative beta-lysine N-acetyltransferase
MSALREGKSAERSDKERLSMELDRIEKIFNSTIQHGHLSARAYLMKLAPGDHLKIITFLDELCRKNKYTKIFAKVPEGVVDCFKSAAYSQEAKIPGFFNGNEPALFMAKYFLPARQRNQQSQKIEEILKTALEKSEADVSPEDPSTYTIEKLKSSYAVPAAEVYRQVFKTYPFPIYDHEYLIETMKKDMAYYCVRKGEQIVALSSATMDRDSKSVEMTDFATLPAWRGKHLAIRLLEAMEKEMVKENMLTAYTIARALSYGMNITFARCGYKYAGTLINNTNISGSIESMNVWYKEI